MSYLKTTAIQHLNASTPAINFDAGGNVGIGTTSTSQTNNGWVSKILSVSSSNNSVLNFTSSSQSAGGLLEWNRTGRSTTTRYAQFQAQTDGSDGGMFYFQTAPAGSDVLVRMTIDSAGRVTKSYQPAFSAYLSGSTGNLGSNTWTKMNLNLTNYNVGNHYDASGNCRFTAPIAGKYLLMGIAHFNDNNDNVSYGVKFYKNGSAIAPSEFRFYTPGNAASDGRGVNRIMNHYIADLAVNDYIELYVLCNGTADQTVAGETTMQGYLLG